MGLSESKSLDCPPSTSRRVAATEGLLQTKYLLQGIPKTRCDEAPPSPPPLPPPGGSTPPPPPASEAPPPPPSSAGDDAIAKAAAEASDVMNPGSYEMAAMDGKRLVTLDTFDGFRCDINKQTSPFMAVVHSFWLGTNMIPDGRKSTYSFLTQVADERRLLMARVDPGRGSIDGRIHYTLPIGLIKTQMAASPEGQADQLLVEFDTGGQTWSSNFKYGSMGGGLVYGCNYFQAITKRLAMGGEGMYVAANGSLLSNYTLKYTMPAKTGDEDAPKPVTHTPPRPPGAPPVDTTGSSTMCVNYNNTQAALSLNYKRVVTPNRVTLAAELQCNPLTLESQVLVGAEFQLQRSKINFCVDGTTGRLQTLVEARLGMGPGSPTLQFSADVDHYNDDMKFGYGINVNG